MSRNQKTVEITSPGRDKGKKFLLTEMPAMQAEKWAIRALFALGKAGFEFTEETRAAGMQAIAREGIGAILRLDFADAEPLLDEMMTCVQIIPDPQSNPNFVRVLWADDIEEVATLAILRAEVFELHTGFSIAAALLNSPAAASETETSQSSPDTQIFHNRSAS